VFQKDGFDYFTDMMPALHNYVTVDTPVFLSNENYILAMFNICKAVSICVSAAAAATNAVWWYVHYSLTPTQNAVKLSLPFHRKVCGINTVHL
jgi:hypothetical protein